MMNENSAEEVPVCENMRDISGIDNIKGLENLIEEPNLDSEKESFSEKEGSLSKDNCRNEKSEEDEWLDIMGSGDFKKKVIKPGLGQETRPCRGDIVTVDISYYISGTLFEHKENFKFIVGDLDVIQGIDLVICLMEKGELAKVVIPSKLAYGAVGKLPEVLPDTDIECDIELKDVEAIDEEKLTLTQRLQMGDDKRIRGNFFYDRGQYIDAIHCYERAALYLDGLRDCSDNSPEELQKVVDMRMKIYNNIAASHMKLNAYSAALKSIEFVLKVQPKNVKALFRKGKILGIQGDTEEAIMCMKLAASLEPDSKIFPFELSKLRNRKNREDQNQRVLYRRMFETEPTKETKAVSWAKKWSIISCGVLALALGSAVAYRQLH